MAQTANIRNFFAQTATSLWSIFCSSGSLCNGISQPAQKPSRSKIRQIWRPGFYIDGCAFLWTLA
jgi:hypothetical protein